MLVLPLLLAACLRAPAPPVTGVLLGSVTLADGAPAAGALLSLRYEPSSEPGSRSSFERTATADASGAYRLEDVRVGVYWLTAQVGTAQSALVQGVEIRENEETLQDVVLAEAGSVTGLALLDDRPQAGGVLVSMPGTPFSATTAAGGAYQLLGVPSGTHSLSFTAQGYASHEESGVTVAAGQATTVPDVTLERVAPYAAFTFVLNGTVVEVDGSASYDATGTVVRYAWDFGDGTRVQGGPELSEFTHEYAGSGQFRISLTVTNDRGNTDTAQQEVTVVLPQLTVGAAPTSVTLPANSNGLWDVIVPAGVSGDVLYLEVQNAESIQVRRGANIYYSTDASTFRRLTGSASALAGTDAARVSPGLGAQAIAVGRVCQGPCVLLPNAGGATLTVHNPGSAARQVTIRLSAEAFNDLNEPNDQQTAATLLAAGTDGGAIELVGDVDWFEVTQDGTLTFDTSPALDLRAIVYDQAGARLNNLSPGVPMQVEAGYRVDVRARAPEAGPSGASAYYLTLD